jgi:hypothetical protein
VHNKKRLAEPGVALGCTMAKNDLVTVLAADETLEGTDWIEKMAKPFAASKEIVAAFPNNLLNKSDNIFNRYYNLVGTPFNFFVFGNSSNRRRMVQNHACKFKTKDFIVPDFSIREHPLIALATGFTFRRSFKRPPGTEYDDVLPVVKMIESGKQIAFVESAAVHHMITTGFRDTLKKYRNRIRNYVLRKDNEFREKFSYFSGKRKLKMLLFFPYSISFVFPFIDSLRGIAKDRDSAWLLHPIMCFSLTVIWAKHLIAHYLGF